MAGIAGGDDQDCGVEHAHMRVLDERAAPGGTHSAMICAAMTTDSRNSSQFTRRLVWGLAAAIVVATITAVLWVLRTQPAGNVFQAIAGLTQVIVFAMFGVIGALILSHRPRHTVGG